MDISKLVSKLLSFARKEAPISHEEYLKFQAKEPELKTAEEWGFGHVEPVLRKGDRGEVVRQFQQWLESLGYELTRFGADGDLGSETLSETRQFQDDHGLTALEDCLKIRGVGPQTYEKVRELGLKAVPAPQILPSTYPVYVFPEYNIHDISGKHTGKKRQGSRSWKDVRGITLHQTATNFGNDPMRYANVAAHLGVTEKGTIVLINNLTDLVWHGNGFNRLDVGIEIDGHFAGVEGDLKTYWRPASKPDRMPMSLSKSQAESALHAIEWVIRTVSINGGKVDYIHAHRQSSKSRSSDPGSDIWQRIGMAAQKQWGLKDGGPEFSLNGYAIPREWNPSYTKPYRQW